MAAEVDALDDSEDPVEVLDSDAVTIAWISGADYLEWRHWLQANDRLPADAWLSKAAAAGVPYRPVSS